MVLPSCLDEGAARRFRAGAGGAVAVGPAAGEVQEEALPEAQATVGQGGDALAEFVRFPELRLQAPAQALQLPGRFAGEPFGQAPQVNVLRGHAQGSGRPALPRGALPAKGFLSLFQLRLPLADVVEGRLVVVPQGCVDGLELFPKHVEKGFFALEVGERRKGEVIEGACQGIGRVKVGHFWYLAASCFFTIAPMPRAPERARCCPRKRSNRPPRMSPPSWGNMVSGSSVWRISLMRAEKNILSKPFATVSMARELIPADVFGITGRFRPSIVGSDSGLSG